MKENIDPYNLPRHIAVIMDGNGRWAKNRGASRIFGHKNAIKAVNEVTEGCTELGIEYLTLYAFSTENWNRPKAEVNGLMRILVSTLGKELDTLNKNNISLKAIGEISNLPVKCQKELKYAVDSTSRNTGMVLTLALSYSGRWEIVNAFKKMACDLRDDKLSPDEINPDLLESYLDSGYMPDPELLIRTSGELRISNFLLWKVAYTELYISKKYWPDFRKPDLYKAILEYQQRERRFGKISEQVK